MSKDNHPLTPRQKRLRLSIWGALLVGFIIGVATAMLEVGSSSDGGGLVTAFFENDLDPTVAIILGLVSVLAIVPLTVMYHKNADEHEERAVLWGSTIGAYTAITLGFLWVVLHKGSILPEPSVVGLLGILCFASLVPYLWLKYR